MQHCTFKAFEQFWVYYHDYVPQERPYYNLADKYPARPVFEPSTSGFEPHMASHHSGSDSGDNVNCGPHRNITGDLSPLI